MLRKAACTSLILALAVTTSATADTYPSRLIRIIVPFGAGSATDTIARMLGQHITETTGQPVVVENKAGANGFLGVQAVTQAPPDGYTILITTQTTQAANVSLFKKLPYDPVKDLVPVSGLSRGALVAVVRKNLPVNSISELTALAKAQPGRITFASGNSSSRAGGELYKMATNIDVIHVPYRSAPQAMNDLIGGQFDFMFVDMVVGMPPALAGQVKALAVTSPTRNKSLPEVPTMEEAGVPGYELAAWTAMYVPAGSPRTVVDRLNLLVREGVTTQRFQQLQTTLSSDFFVGTPEELAEFQAREIEKWAKIVKAAGLAQP